MSFPARKSKIELKIAMKTWDILKATYLIALLHISNDNTAYLFEISRYIKYFETRTIRLLDSLVIGNILAKFENNLSSSFFFSEE